jgi:LEA14-like dessication related protein
MKYRLIALGLIALVLSACSVFKEPQFNKVNEIALKDLTADHTSLDLSIVITNPNWYAITVKSLKIEVQDKNSEKLGDIMMTQPLKIEKHSADTVYFEILMNTRKVAKMLSYSTGKVEFTVKAYAVAKVFGISKKIRLEQPQEVNFTQIIEEMLPTIPSDIEIPAINASELTKGKKDRKLLFKDTDIKSMNSSPFKPDIFKVMKTTVTDIGLKETELTVKFLLLNPYGFAFTFKDFPAEIRINDKFAGRGNLAQPIVLNENVISSDGELVFKLNNLNSFLLATGALVKKDMNYVVNGTLQIEGFGTKINKPFKFRGTIEIGKKDK